VEAAYGKANAPSESAQLGSSISLDGKWLAVGAPGHSSDAHGINGDEGNLDRPLSGAVYIFEQDDGGWKQQAFIKAAQPDAEDLFGFAVALKGNILVVGAPEEDGDSPGVDGDESSNETATAGAVYVFERSGSEWRQAAYLKAAEPSESASFGHSLALDRFRPKTGTNALWRLVVGAYHDGNSAVGVDPSERDMASPTSGAAYVFDNTGDGWKQTAYLKASNTDPGDAFGTSVALAGNTVVVGAPDEKSAGQGPSADPDDDSAFASGAAYVFAYDEANQAWTQSAYLKPDNSAADFRFGTTLTIEHSTIAVSALTEPSSRTGIDPEPGNLDAPEAGAVYVFDHDVFDHDAEGGWQQTAYLKASNSDVRDHFGAALGLRGNALAVGAPLEASAQPGIQPPQDDNTAPGAGAVYLFFRKDGEWSQQAYFKASNAQPGDNFGLALGFDGVQLAVGAPYEDSSAGGITSASGGPNNAARAAGAVYWFR
jgi:trimeric autotransporter adhesin